MSADNRIRVMHVVHSFRAGGMENMIAQMAWKLPPSEFALMICSLTDSDTFKSRLPPGTSVVDLNKTPGLNLHCVLKLRGLIKQFNPMVIHSHNWDGLLYSWTAILGTNYILLQGEHAQFYEWERSILRLKIRSALYARCSILHTVSRGQAAEIGLLGLAKGVELKVVQNGVDTALFSPKSKSECRSILGIPSNAICLGMVARCISDKRHHLLLDAFRELAVESPELMLIFAGGGGDREAEILKMVEDHPFRERIRWLGHRNDMPGVYCSFDLLVLPSKTEGMSNVCLEAMSCGLPALVHESCGADELIKDCFNGFVRSINSAQDLIKPLKELLSMPKLLKTVGINARASAVKFYPLNRVEEDYANIYRQLAGRLV